MKKVLTATLATLAVILFSIGTQAQGLDEQVQVLTQKMEESEKAHKKEITELKQTVASLQTKVGETNTAITNTWTHVQGLKDTMVKVKEVLVGVTENTLANKAKLQNLDDAYAKLFPLKPILDTAGNVIDEPTITAEEGIALQHQEVKSKVGMLVFLVTATVILALLALSHRSKIKAVAALRIPPPAPQNVPGPTQHAHASN